MKKDKEKFLDQHCRYLADKARKKARWGEKLLVCIEPEIHRKVAIHAAEYGLTPTKFVEQLIKEWVESQ